VLNQAVCCGAPHNSTLERMDKPRSRYPLRWVLVPCVALFGLAALHFYEWWWVGHVADPKAIANYHFGSEAMIAHGGDHYRSAEAYAASALKLSVAQVILAIPFLAALLLKARWALWAAYIVLAAVAIGIQLLPHAL
jgi:hypothetical protein